MAARKKGDIGIKDFCRSEEEEIVQSVFKNIVHDCNGILPAFLNLVIDCSNAKSGRFFGDARVGLALCYECGEAYSLNYKRGYPECGCVYTKDLLALDVIKEFLNDGVDAIEKYPASCRSFLALFEFLRDRRKHEEAIQNLAKDLPTNGSKTQIMVGLAHHFFSQLIPGKKYEVDEYAKHLPERCDCGCKENICKGDTSIGSERTWHGRVDIILNDAIAVTLGDEETESDEEDKDDDDNDTDAEPAKKQRKFETENTEDICVEEKTNQKHDSVLLETKVVEEILAKAVTNGFAQVNRSESTLSNFLIPTIAATVDHVCVCLYDPQYDCLLLSEEWMNLWIPHKNILDYKIIVVVWLFLNFTVFTKTKMAARYNLDQSGLHAQLQNHLLYYRQVETGKKIVPLPWIFAKNYKVAVCQ
ncbi:uncharacterized protein LOC117342756 [Pecten maximus]|uniref:uncharacterized protein LOC117342756 n=1 Tax=Pecten maximus TaxID=6579 RepID=UPI0014586294|nr:uncharacterized protein LOC117342756 [Pecten maximus]